MHATDIIGFTADADYWCSTCAERVYGPDSESRKDGEGNDVHPIFVSDETPANTVCSSCGAACVMTGATAPVAEWTCCCGMTVDVRADRIVPDHISPAVGRWCSVSRCTLTPRVLGRAA